MMFKVTSLIIDFLIFTMNLQIYFTLLKMNLVVISIIQRYK
jgi:hypothetical protein